MIDPDVEVHRSEITRSNRTTPVAILVAVVAAIVTLIVTDSDEPSPDEPTEDRATSTTDPAPHASLPPTIALGFSGADMFVIGRTTGPLTEVRPEGIARDAEDAVVTEDRIAIIDSDGQILVGDEGGSFAAVTCCHDAIVASNESGHVWAIDLGERAVLVDLGRGPTGVDIDLDGERVIGLGSFGVVTVGADDAASWRRPGFDAAPVTVPEGRVAVSSGGKLVAYVVPETRVVEVRRTVDGMLVRSFAARGTGPVTARLSTVGDTVAIVRRGAIEAFGVADGRAVGGMRATGDGPVPVGAGRFAVSAGGVVIDSHGRRIDTGVDEALIATRAE